MRERLPLGWWGMAMLIASEAALFAMMIGSYFLLRFKNLAWPPPGIPEPKLLVPLTLLGVLLLSLVPLTKGWVLVALLMQAGYFAMELQLYSDDLRTFTPQDHAYGSLYFTLLGADHAHVAVGLLLSAWLLWKRGDRVRKPVLFYWYAVAVLTVAVTLTVLSPAIA
jgi:heme/copper-type cytochrome/quinol oxidase subunit 3